MGGFPIIRPSFSAKSFLRSLGRICSSVSGSCIDGRYFFLHIFLSLESLLFEVKHNVFFLAFTFLFHTYIYTTYFYFSTSDIIMLTSHLEDGAVTLLPSP